MVAWCRCTQSTYLVGPDRTTCSSSPHTGHGMRSPLTVPERRPRRGSVSRRWRDTATAWISLSSPGEWSPTASPPSVAPSLLAPLAKRERMDSETSTSSSRLRPSRGTIRVDGWPVDQFVHTHESIAYWQTGSGSRADAPWPTCSATGTALTGPDVDAGSARARPHFAAPGDIAGPMAASPTSSRRWIGSRPSCTTGGPRACRRLTSRSARHASAAANDPAGPSRPDLCSVVHVVW